MSQSMLRKKVKSLLHFYLEQNALRLPPESMDGSFYFEISGNHFRVCIQDLIEEYGQHQEESMIEEFVKGIVNYSQ